MLYKMDVLHLKFIKNDSQLNEYIKLQTHFKVYDNIPLQNTFSLKKHIYLEIRRTITKN